MTIKIWLGLALTISVGLNLLLIWFSKEQSRRLSYVSQNLGDLVELISDYGEHLKKVYSMEMFYGDQTLEFLMSHTRTMVELIQKEYGDITSITDPLETIIIEEESDEENEKEIEGQNVFYAGSRRRDS
tara:strand:+ start:6261 stop:6647 length:387 start_codon:yes stop_codon:yes gene_type:complete